MVRLLLACVELLGFVMLVAAVIAILGWWFAIGAAGVGLIVLSFMLDRALPPREKPAPGGDA